MSKLYNGGASFGFSLDFNTAVPVDTRFVVPTLTDLLNPQTWISGAYDSANDANNVYTVYPGLHVIVKSEATIYVFNSDTVNGTTLANQASWTKLATGGVTTEILEQIGEKTDPSTADTVYGAIKKEAEDRAAAIDGLNATETGSDTDNFVTVKVTEEKGKITKVEVTSNDIAAKTYVDGKITNSATLKNDTNSWEIQATIKYVPAKTGVPAHIALVDKNNVELSTVDVSDIIGNGLIKSHNYDSTTGNLTLTFNQADGTTKDTVIDLGKMLDIDDVLIDTESQKYLSVDLTGQEQSQAVFKALIVKMANATAGNTGLADAYDVKKYVDDSIDAITLTASGDDYVGATVGTDKVIKVTTNTGTLTTDATTGDLGGTAKTLVDGKEIADKVNASVDKKIENLDASKTGTGTNITVKVDETDGKISEVTVTEGYSTVTRVAGDNPSLTIADPTKLATGADIEKVKGYSEDIVERDTRFEKGTGTNSAKLKGTGTSTTNEAEVAVGKYNNSSTGTDSSNKTIFSVGNGTSATDKSNAVEVRENGDIWINIGTDYKKLQTILSNEIDWYEGD